MKKTTSVIELRESIVLLEIKQANDIVLLKEQFKVTLESLKSINLFKDQFNELTSSPNLKHDIVNCLLGLAAGYVSKKVAVGPAGNLFKQICSKLLQIGVTSFVSKNADEIKSTVSHLLKKEPLT